MKSHRPRARLTDKQKVDIVHAYEVDLESMVDIAKRYSVSRQCIYKVLKRAGVDTSKRRLPVSCEVCGSITYKPKCQIRARKHMFCSADCYHAWLQAGAAGVSTSDQRKGSRLARAKVSEYFTLQPGHIVHHENHNPLDNRLENLRVFACQGDHIRYHRGFDVDPIWDGRYA